MVSIYDAQSSGVSPHDDGIGVVHTLVVAGVSFIQYWFATEKKFKKERLAYRMCFSIIFIIIGRLFPCLPIAHDEVYGVGIIGVWISRFFCVKFLQQSVERWGRGLVFPVNQVEDL